MRRLTVCAVLVHSLFLGIGQANAQQMSVRQKSPDAGTGSTAMSDRMLEEAINRGLYNQPGKRSQLVAGASTLQNSLSSVWVIEEKKPPKLQPFLWVVKDVKQQQAQPLLWVVKNAKKNAPLSFDADFKKNNKEEIKKFDEVIKGTKKLEGLFPLYQNKETGKIYLEVSPQQLNKNYLGTITMDSGIGERGIYSGLALQDFLFYFQRVNKNLHFVVRNVNFRTRPGDPQERSLDRSFSDSVLYSLNIVSIHPERKTLLIDLGDLLLNDVPGLTTLLKDVLDARYELDENKSYFGTAKAFPENIEIQSVYGFSSATGADVETLPDSRALTLKVHYSFSALPENNNYVPRLADDRIGYFLTAYQDFADDNRRERFTRYINRWHLEPSNPNAPLSPPKKPIIFWIDNSVPLNYRDAIKEGVLMWNKAFEKAGFKNAIEVRQMPDNPTWDPADVRYNTIRWFNSLDAEFARGPSRTNPLTGEILDADIVVDANMLRSLKQQYRNLIEPSQSQGSEGQRSRGVEEQKSRRAGELCGWNAKSSQNSRKRGIEQLAQDQDLCYGMESVEQSAMGELSLSILQNVLPGSDQMKDYINQYLRSLIAHEVGHTLGLRHNFNGSTLLKPEDLNNPAITRTRGMVSSVMDYVPVNLAPPGIKQGDYFPVVVGPYDEWAIEYGYKPSGAKFPGAERRFLQDIASRSAQPELAYATDEDSVDINPDANQWDISGDLLVYSQWQMDNVRTIWDRLGKRYPTPGESFSEVRLLFNVALGYYSRQANLITQYIGGQSFSRNHAGDPNARSPFIPVPVAKQREALKQISKYVFAPDAFNFSPELLNDLAPSRWSHWGNPIPVLRLDYPIHDRILNLQRGVLRSLLEGDRLNRLRDMELKTQQGQALTLPELFETLQKSIWTEVLQNGETRQISSIRRALQREHLDIMLAMVLRNDSVPEDARTLAWYELRQLRKALDGATRSSGKLDTYTKAHLEETRDRITKALDAKLQSN